MTTPQLREILDAIVALIVELESSHDRPMGERSPIYESTAHVKRLIGQLGDCHPAPQGET